MSVLARQDLVKRLEEEPLGSEKRLVVAPLLDPDQIGVNSIDLRLGPEFVTVRRSNLTSVDPGQAEEFQRHLGQYQETIRVRPGEKFVLHPGQLVLGSTFEYVGIPLDASGHILGRSSWGRVGLIIETAPIVESGFRGVITLELINDGLIPLELRTGYRICQLVLLQASRANPYVGRYNCPTSPEFGMLPTDGDIDFWLNPDRRWGANPEAPD